LVRFIGVGGTWLVCIFKNLTDFIPPL
jgi:hypothetical protein